LSMSAVPSSSAKLRLLSASQLGRKRRGAAARRWFDARGVAAARRQREEGQEHETCGGKSSHERQW